MTQVKILIRTESPNFPNRTTQNILTLSNHIFQSKEKHQKGILREMWFPPIIRAPKVRSMIIRFGYTKESIKMLVRCTRS